MDVDVALLHQARADDVFERLPGVVCLIVAIPGHPALFEPTVDANADDLIRLPDLSRFVLLRAAFDLPGSGLTFSRGGVSPYLLGEMGTAGHAWRCSAAKTGPANGPMCSHGWQTAHSAPLQFWASHAGAHSLARCGCAHACASLRRGVGRVRGGALRAMCAAQAYRASRLHGLPSALHGRKTYNNRSGSRLGVPRIVVLQL